MHTKHEGRLAPSSSPARPWLVVALCFAFNFIGRGVGDTFMVFLLPLGAEFGWPRSHMTSVYSALMVVSGLAAPLAGLVFERFGPRVLYASGLALIGLGYGLAGQASALWHFYVCIGLLGGIGASALGVVPSSALVSRWFEQRLSTAISLVYAGYGCGTLVIVPLVQMLIGGPGWRSAYHWIGGTALVLLPLSLLLPWGVIRAGRVPERQATRVSQAATLQALRHALRDRRFWLMVQVMFFTAVGVFIIIVQSVAYFVDVGYTPLQAAGAFGTAGLLSVLGVSAIGWLADRFGYRRAATLSFGGTLCGMAVLLWMSFDSAHGLLAVYLLLFGLSQGARGPLVASLNARFFPGTGQAAIYGAVYTCLSIGSGLGALLAGVLHDLTGGYRASFLLAMVCILLAAAPFWYSDVLKAAARPAA